MRLEPLFAGDISPTKHTSAIKVNPSVGGQNFIKNNFTLSTWLAVGAFLQCILFLLPVRPFYTLGPAILVLAFKITDNLLMIFGYKRNVFMDGVIPHKFSAVLPDSDGSFDRKGAESDPSGGSMCVLHLNVRSNHPLGMFAPGFKEIGGYFQSMIDDIEAHAEDFGFLGAKNWINTDERTSNPELMVVFYFRTMDDVHKFAHAPSHREGWDWWNKTVGKHPHLGISHEVFEAPAGKWETIYAQFQLSGLATASVPVTNQNGETNWVRPVVDATRGVLRTNRGRRGLVPTGDDNEKYGPVKH